MGRVEPVAVALATCRALNASCWSEGSTPRPVGRVRLKGGELGCLNDQSWSGLENKDLSHTKSLTNYWFRDPEVLDITG